MSDKAFYGVQRTEPEPEGEHIRTILAAGFIPIPISRGCSSRMSVR